MLARRLRKRGFSVDTAADGREALRRVDETPYDLVLLDVMMPGMSGLEVLEVLRQTFPRADLPIIMATAKTGSDDMVEALARGANDYVTKPIDFPVVLARIESHLQTRQQAPSLPAPSALFPADGKAPAGTVLDGRYEVVRTIGEGSFAVVFEARQISTGQRVAVKVLRHHRASDEDTVDRRRFEREMKMIGMLHHPNIVRLVDSGTLKASVTQVSTGWIEATEGAGFDVDETSGGTRVIVRRLPYIVMELLEGQTLQELSKERGPLPPDVAVDLLLGVIGAVAEGHRVGVVHRDLKPPNILVTRTVGDQLHPVVLDFGISKPHDEDTLMRPEESFLGTPEYMAPEVLRGTQSADELADQYAIGAMLHELLVGDRPFRAGSYVELLQAVSEGDCRSILDAEPSVPVGLVSVVERAMDRERARRFSNLLTFGRALLPFASGARREHWSSTFSVPTDPPPPPRQVAQDIRERTTGDLLESALEVSSTEQAKRATRAAVALLVAGALLVAAALIVMWAK